MGSDGDLVCEPGDLIVIESSGGGRQIGMVSEWIDDRHFRAWKFLMVSRRWSRLKTLHVDTIVGPIEIHAQRGSMRKALVAARKVGYPT